jgi:phage portal protein BeeE
MRVLGRMLGDWLGPVKLAVDADQLTELADDRAKLWEQVGAAAFLSDAEKRDYLGFGAATA